MTGKSVTGRRPARGKPIDPNDTPAMRCPFRRGDRFRERVTGDEGTVVDAVNEYGCTIKLDRWQGMERPPYGGSMPYCVGLLERIPATNSGA